MPQPQYKVVYFNGRGRAEVPRLLLTLAGVPFEDVRYEQDQWKAAKEKFNAPFGQLPCLSIDGKLYSQSLSISRYIAEKYGFAGKTDLEKFRADMVVHCIEDVAQALFKAGFEPDEKKKETLIQKLKDEDLKTHFTNLENILKQNKGGDSYFVGDSITWADVTFAHYSDYLVIAGLDNNTFLSSYPKLKALKDKVVKQPKIAEWIVKRPTTQF